MEFYPVAAIRNDSVYLVHEETEFNKLMKAEPFAISTESEAKFVVMEYLRFEFFNPKRELLYPKTINELPSKIRLFLSQAVISLPENIKLREQLLDDKSITDTYRK